MTGAGLQALEADILARSPGEMVPLLYQHLLSHLRDAADAMDAGDDARRATHADRGLAILFELMGSLDRDRGGEIAARLSALYSYFASVVIDLGRTRDAELLRRVIDMVAMLHHSWERAALETAGPGRATGR